MIEYMGIDYTSIFNLVTTHYFILITKINV